MNVRQPDPSRRPPLHAAHVADEPGEDDVWSDVPWPVASGELRDRDEQPRPAVQLASDAERIRRVI